jgi:hypothetical protein
MPHDQQLDSAERIARRPSPLVLRKFVEEVRQRST